MHKYRTHNCGALRLEHVGQIVKLSGWIHKIRNHGNLVFIDLRDHFGITQLIINQNNKESITIDNLKHESVITVIGEVLARTKNTINTILITGMIEVIIHKIIVESYSQVLPFKINSHEELSEDIRLKYRFLDLRREKYHNNIILRSKIISYIRHLMTKEGFIEFQTPILTASSPEGARDFLVPSRLHPGKFYALPQAPQQFKQLIMIAGFDKYFQIAPCFRDEDSRSDRSPGEFYQLDIEMSFITQEDIFNTIEPIIYNIFSKFSNNIISPYPFIKIPYKEAISKYGTDKPDLRNPIIIQDITEEFQNLNLDIFKEKIKQGFIIKAILAPKAATMPKSFFNKIITLIKSKEFNKIEYIQFFDNQNIKGSIIKFLNQNQLLKLKSLTNIKNGDAIFLIIDQPKHSIYLSGKLRTKIAEELNLINNNIFKFCWIIDIPLYKKNYQTNEIEFYHNPFSMPQGDINILDSINNIDDILNIKAYQYDIICNGVELSSGAIRNHKLDTMYKVFNVIGYNKEKVNKEFKALIRAFNYGVPPHGGIAPGIDRIIMLLTKSNNIRETIAFPLNQQAEDSLTGAPNYIKNEELKYLGIKTI